ncbi:MAG TPA: hypothetical protein VHE35_03660 [Kofleriaceae bacterium]|nr:hypothetical protein [Kofleriaceae bacterium]
MLRRKLGIVVSTAAVASLAWACSPGEVADVAPPDVDRVECTTDFEVNGTFATSVSPAPTATDGCVPDGTWTINLSQVPDGECATTKYQAQYIVQVAGMGRDRTFTLTNPAGTAERKFNLSAGGGGECEMSLEEISPATAPEYHRLLVKPYTEPGGNTVAGSATYELWSSKP